MWRLWTNPGLENAGTSYGRGNRWPLPYDVRGGSIPSARHRMCQPSGQDGAVESVEIARAETERGDVVLRRRTSDTAADVRRAAGQRRLRDGHPRDHQRDRARRPGPRPRRRAEGGADRRAGARLHAATGAGRRRASSGQSWSRSRSRSSSGCATGRCRTARPSWPTRGPPSSTPTSRWRSPRRGRRTTWCCSTSTTAPGYLVHEGNEAVYEERVPAPLPRPAEPRRRARVWSANAAPDLLAAMREVFGARRGAGPRRAAAGPAGAVLPLPRAALSRSSAGTPRARVRRSASPTRRSPRTPRPPGRRGWRSSRRGSAGCPDASGSPYSAVPVFAPTSRRARRAGTVPTRSSPRPASGRAACRPLPRSAAPRAASARPGGPGSSTGSTARPAETDAATVAMANGTGEHGALADHVGRGTGLGLGGGTWPK